MPTDPDEDERQPTRGEVERMTGPVLLEFGAAWCGRCQALGSMLAGPLEEQHDAPPLKSEDGPSQLLGRSFEIKLPLICVQ